MVLPRQSGTSPVIWHHTVLPATRHRWTRPALTPASKLVVSGTQFTYPGGMEGWVDLGYPAVHRPGVEPAISRSQVRLPAISRSQVQRPNHYSTQQPKRKRSTNRYRPFNEQQQLSQKRRLWKCYWLWYKKNVFHNQTKTKTTQRLHQCKWLLLLTNIAIYNSRWPTCMMSFQCRLKVMTWEW